MHSPSDIDSPSELSSQIKSLKVRKDSLLTGKWETYLDELKKLATELGLWQVIKDGNIANWKARIQKEGFKLTLADLERRM